MRIGHGYDIHRLAEGLPLRLGGVTIPHSKGCVAHSDGDVVVHALCDALLGAVAAGDIGLHFPDNAPEFKSIDSMVLLGKTMNLIKDYIISNIDITIELEVPKLRPYIDQMRAELSKALGVETSMVSVKATTTEGLGPIGRGEAVAATAVVLLN